MLQPQQTNSEKQGFAKANIENLVFQGGSVRGIAYLGSLQELHRQDITMSRIKRVAGTSAGAITAALLAVGFNLEELQRELNQLDFKDFLDEQGGQTREALFGAIERGKDAQTAQGKVSASGYAVCQSPAISRGMSRICATFGVYDGEFFRQWIEERLYVKTGIKNITFAELNQQQRKNPHKYKNLFLMGANISTHSSEVFSYLATPNLVIADAVRISMSIPLLFKPHHLFIKDQQGNIIKDPRAHVYVDGGLLDNYPITIFDQAGFMDSSLQPDDPAFAVPCLNLRTLGLRLVPKKEVDYYCSGEEKAQENQITGLFTYFKAIIGTLHAKQESDHNQRGDKVRSIYIDTQGVGMLDFNLDPDAKQLLITSGIEGVRKDFRKDKPSIALTHAPRQDEAEAKFASEPSANSQQFANPLIATPQSSRRQDDREQNKTPIADRQNVRP